MNNSITKPIDVMIAGAPKAGTSSLKNYLWQHPQVCMHKQREFPFFTSDEMYPAGYEAYYKEYFGGLQLTDSHLLVAKSAPISCLPQAIERLYQHNPEMKIVLLLRNPIERAYSSYRFLRQRGIEPLNSFEEAIAEEPRRLEKAAGDLKQIVRWGYITPGFYIEPVMHFHSLFGAEKVRVYQFEKLKQSPVLICKNLFDWLNIDPSFAPNVEERFNVTKEPRSQFIARGFANFFDSDHFAKNLVKKILPSGIATEIKYLTGKFNSRTAKKVDMNPQTRQKLAEIFYQKNKALAGVVDIDLTLWE